MNPSTLKALEVITNLKVALDNGHDTSIQQEFLEEHTTIEIHDIEAMIAEIADEDTMDGLMEMVAFLEEHLGDEW